MDLSERDYILLHVVVQDSMFDLVEIIGHTEREVQQRTWYVQRS